MEKTENMNMIDKYEVAKLTMNLRMLDEIIESDFQTVIGWLADAEVHKDDLTVEEAQEVMVHALREGGGAASTRQAVANIVEQFDSQSIKHVCGCDADIDAVIRHVVANLEQYNPEDEENEEGVE